MSSLSGAGLNGNHFMIDLETLSTKSNAVICSIGIIEFDILSGENKRSFYETVDIKSCLDIGLEIDSGTLTWWLSQPEKPRLEINKSGSKKLDKVLELVTKFINQNDSESYNNKTNNFVWGNGSSFDLGILSNAFNKCNLVVPWKFWNERDVRTILALSPEIKKNIKNSGTLHNALDDCKFQIEYCTSIIRKIYQVKSY